MTPSGPTTLVYVAYEPGMFAAGTSEENSYDPSGRRTIVVSPALEGKLFRDRL